MMEFFRGLSLTVGLPIFALGLHEITHLIVARTMGPISVELVSLLPFQLELSFQHTVSKFAIRLVALAPLFVGSIVAAIAIQGGLWQQLREANPYYLHFLIGINWFLYTFPSPTDLRSALTTVERPTDEELI
jgi:hypothetical protein